MASEGKYKGRLRLLCLATAVAVGVCSFSFSAFASGDGQRVETPGDSGVETAAEAPGTGEIPDFDTYLSLRESSGFPEIPDTAAVWENRQAEGLEGPVRRGAVADAVRVFASGAQVVWSVQLPQAGFYAVRLSCFVPSAEEQTPRYSVYVNGALLHRQAQGLDFPLRYQNAGEIVSDQKGNDIRPKKQLVPTWTEFYICNPDYNASGWMPVYFEAGVNSLTLNVDADEIFLTAPVICQPSAALPYDDYLRQMQTKPDEVAETYTDLFEGEGASATSSTELYPTYDRTGAKTCPNDPYRLRLNTIGQNTWNRSGQWIEWEIDVPTDGFYQIGGRVRQNVSRDLTSYRRLFVDGSVCFDACSRLAFPYDRQWYTALFGEGDTPYLFYLTAGRHVLRLEAVLGELGDRVVALESIASEFNALYRRIIMITGTEQSVDPWRDYMLDQQIPGLSDQLQSLKARLTEEQERLEALQVDASSNMAQLLYQIDLFLRNPEKIPQMIGAFRSNITTLSAWAQSLKNQPLEVDYLFVKSPKAETPAPAGGLFDTLAFRFRLLLASYTTDYAQLSVAGESEETITVWTSGGRDQSQVLLDLINNRFSPQNSVSVSLSMMQMGLNEAIAAGRNPDVMLFYTGDVVPLAARGVLADLSRYDGFAALKERFVSSAFVPFTYENGIYGVPLEQTPLMLFYRTDIFEELELTPPKTWDEFMEVLTILQNNRLTAGLSAGTTTVPNISLFELLVYQSGGRILSEDLCSTELDSEICYRAFKQWTEFFTRHSLEPEMQFFERFRSGEVPIAIQSASVYSQLRLGAPEIVGLWEMAPVPQTPLADGSASSLTVGAFTPAIVFQNDHVELCFSFLDWLTSAETQRDYGREVESLLGIGARYFTANVEAVRHLNWTPAEVDLLTSQMQSMTVTPAIPASYYLGRNVTNAFRKVYNQGYQPREAMLMYQSVIDSEIAHKNEEIKRQSQRRESR